MLDLIANKILRPFGFRLVKLEEGIKIRGFMGNKTFNVGNYRIVSPRKHPLSKNLRQFKFYSRNLSRLVEAVGESIPDLEVIDVGANIGDSAAFINSIKIKPNKIYCFEGDSEYIKYFKINTSKMDNIVLFDTFLGEDEREKEFSVVKDNGTLRIDTENKGIIKINTLEKISTSNPELFNVKFLKTDTDGYDFKILRGAKRMLEKAKPILFFEYDREYLNNVKDDGFSTFEMLQTIGYNNAILYDNYGRLLVTLDIEHNKRILEELDLYMSDKKGAFHYYDVCLFHKEDNKIFEQVLNKEIEFFKKELS